MAFPTSALLLGVANLLIARWKPKLRGDRSGLLPSDLELADGLRRLIIEDESLEKILGGITDPAKVELELLEEAIKEFQESIGALKVDGILGNKSLTDLLASLTCLKQLPRPTTELNEAFRKMVNKIANEQGGDPHAENWYLYHVEELPIVPGPVSADILVKKAWAMWQKYANVRVERLPRRLKEAANVIFKTADLPNSILGRAHVGAPPSKFVLEIEMDRSRTWDPVLFEGAVAHEIGHVLGLEHQTVPGLLMSEHVKSDWREHVEEDGKRAAQLDWLGPSPIIEEEPIIEGDFDALRFRRRRRRRQNG